MTKHACSFLYRSDWRYLCDNMERKRVSFFLPTKKNKNEKADNIHKLSKRQDTFDKSRKMKKVEKTDNPEKIPFDKKAYRLKKYSKKYKLEQWEEQRKKKLIREYQKEVKNEPAAGTYKPKSFDEDTTDSQTLGKYVRHPDILEKENLKIKAVKEEIEPKAKKDPLKKAKDYYNKVKEEKAKKREDQEKVIAERNKKLQEYKKIKHERYKKLSKKTKKGQPMMTGRMELLLEKIQKGSK